MVNLEQTRFNMVEQQIRTWNVLNQDILDLLYQVKREEFVPAAYRFMAFVDMEIPLEHGAVMLTPKMEARILQELHIRKTDKILEVGTGTGYMTALLSKLGTHVFSVEICPSFIPWRTSICRRTTLPMSPLNWEMPLVDGPVTDLMTSSF